MFPSAENGILTMIQVGEVAVGDRESHYEILSETFHLCVFCTGSCEHSGQEEQENCGQLKITKSFS